MERPLLTGVAFGELRDRLLRKTGEEGVVGREDEPEGGSSWCMVQKEDNDAHYGTLYAMKIKKKHFL